MTGRPGPSRRQVLGGFALGAAAGLAGPALAACGSSGSGSATAAASSHGGSLSIYSFSDYFAQKNLTAFTKQTGTTVNISTFDSNDAMFAKLNATNGGSFDISIATGGWVPLLASKNLITKLDHGKLSLDSIDPNLLNLPFDPHNVYSVPKDYGVFGVTYDPAAIGGDIVTWQDFLDAGSRPGVTGKFDAGGGAAEILGVALWAAGQDWNTDDRAILDKAAATMTAFGKHAKQFNGFDVTGLANGSLVMSGSDQSVARQAIEQNPKLKFVVPEPHSELWIDSYVILKNAAHPAQAYSFLDFELEPAHQITDTEFIGYPTALQGLENDLPASLPLKSDIFISPAVLGRLQTWIVRAQTQGYIEDLYNKITAGSSS